MTPLYPWKFEPLFKSMLWGGSQLAPYFGRPASPDPIGEAWVLSDVDGSPSVVANGPLAGKTLRELLAMNSREILGPARLINGRFPLLLKFIDARQALSVQVHPTDEQAKAKNPRQNGKTEAWVVLGSNPSTSRIYAGFQPGVTAETFRRAMAEKTTPDTLHQFTPKPGDCLFLRAGTVHAIGADTFLFEVQQTSDITYRLYDWDRVDPKTGSGRELHIDDGLACSNFASGPCDPVTPVADGPRERLVDCEYFTLHHRRTATETTLGSIDRCTVVVCVDGHGRLNDEPLRPGDVILVPAAVGTVTLRPEGTVRLLECGLPSAD